MISKTYAGIINYLTEKKEYATALEISEQFEVSVRSIKRYIKDINYFLDKYGVEITSAKGLGYKIEGPLKEINNINENIINDFSGLIMDDSVEKRISKVICILINREYATAEELSLNLNLSIPSINILMSSVKCILKKYDLSIESKPFHGSKILGEEIKIRSLIFDYAINIFENQDLSVKLDNISDKQIDKIKIIVKDILINNSIILSDRDFNVLLGRILISLSRVDKNCPIGENFIRTNKQQNYELISNIMKGVSETFNSELKEGEILYVSSSYGMINYNYNTGKDLTANSHQDIEEFVDKALKDIFLITGIDYAKDKVFVNSLVMHINIYINRFRAGVMAKNPLLKQIKAEFPMETNLAAIIAARLKTDFNVSLDEDEIGFVALHFGVASERRRGYNGKKVCIICQYGIGTSQLLAEKLKQRIGDINIVGTYPVSYLDEALKQDINFIVSTVKLDNDNIKVPVLYVKNIFSDEIINELGNCIKEKERRATLLLETFKSDAFFRIKAKTCEEAIKSIGEGMKAKGLIDNETIENVLEREKISSTDIGNLVAIPHTIVNGNYKSVIGVGILEKPIKWNNEEVQLVLMVCFNREESYKFKVFEYLYSFIKDQSEVKRTLKAMDFGSFIKCWL